MTSLDPDAAEAFVLVAELRSFTRAAAALNTTQAAISLRIRRLEERLGVRLLERTPRQVRLSIAGERFVSAASDYVKAGRRAALALSDAPSRLALGITHHLLGPGLSGLLQRIAQREAGITFHLRTGSSRTLMDLYDQGLLDAIVVLRHDESRRDGEFLLTEEFGWFATDDLRPSPGMPVPLALQPEPCNLRAMALRSCEAAGITWREAFVGEGAAVVGAVAGAGLAVAPLANRAAPSGTRDVGEAFGLPPLPNRAAILHSHIADRQALIALRAVVEAYKRT